MGLEPVFRGGLGCGDGDLDYQAVAEVIDTARGAGWERVGLMTH